jgi:hypothetical protein
VKSAATWRWIGLALLGLLIAAGVSIAASRLASQQIGLASEPIEAGDALAPVTRSPHHRPQGGQVSRPKRAPTTAPPPLNPAAPPVAAPEPPATTVPAAPERAPGRSASGDGEHGGGRGGGGHADD